MNDFTLQASKSRYFYADIFIQRQIEIRYMLLLWLEMR